MNYVLQSFICLTIFMATSTASAEASLKIASAFNIKAVNGAIYSSGLVNQNRHLALSPGINLIALDYEEAFKNDYDDSFEIVKSNIFLLTIYLENNQEYQQRYIKPHDAKAARRYSTNPIFEIISIANRDNQQRTVKFEFEALASDQTSFIIEKTRIGANRSINLTKSSDKNNDTQGKLINNAPQITPQTTAFKMLDYWWLQASPEERRKFLETHSINQ